MLSPPSRFHWRVSGGGLRQLILSVYPTISHDPTRNLMKLLRKDSLSGTGCPLTVRTRNRVTKMILPSPGHHNISDVPSRHSLNSRDSRNHSPVPFLRFCMNSFWEAWKLREESQLPIT